MQKNTVSLSFFFLLLTIDGTVGTQEILFHLILANLQECRWEIPRRISHSSAAAHQTQRVKVFLIYSRAHLDLDARSIINVYARATAKFQICATQIPSAGIIFHLEGFQKGFAGRESVTPPMLCTCWNLWVRHIDIIFRSVGLSGGEPKLISQRDERCWRIRTVSGVGGGGWWSFAGLLMIRFASALL